ncbi:MAG: DNA repair protein RecN [Bacillota bacterium]|nr:DNA repair protein RecN [Bacillota bacterium]
MLFELHIKDFILIEDVKIGFEQGFNTITGETGAGKSMILGAIDLVSGEQANKDSVRIGADKTLISASFYTNDKVNLYLTEMGIACDDDLVILSREVQAKGKSISRINGQIVTLNHLKEITKNLIQIHGQNDNQTLLIREEQLNLLDKFGGTENIRTRQQIQHLFNEIRTLRSEIALLEEKSYDRQRQTDFLSFQIEEIDNAKLKIGEDLALEKEFELLTHLGSIVEVFERATGWMSGEFGDGAVSEVSSIANAYSKLVHYDESLDDFSKRFKEIYFLMDDLSKDVVDYKSKLDQDPERLEWIERRLDEINHLKSKYGKTIEVIFDLKSKFQTELDAYENVEEQLKSEKQRLDSLLKEYSNISEVLTSLRLKASIAFEEALQKELTELNMKETNFKIDLNKLYEPTAHGLDEIEFTISTNIGQPFRPLKKVVSGGELSRIMLGIKIVLGKMDAIPTLVFDEIDTGISGVTANVVGEKLAKLSSYSQVIIITHLPQIAVFSDHHLLIEKNVEDQNTLTHIKPITSKEVENEINRLVGGLEVTETTSIHSREMIQTAHKKKELFKKEHKK